MTKSFANDSFKPWPIRWWTIHIRWTYIFKYHHWEYSSSELNRSFANEWFQITLRRIFQFFFKFRSVGFKFYMIQKMTRWLNEDFRMIIDYFMTSDGKPSTSYHLDDNKELIKPCFFSLHDRILNPNTTHIRRISRLKLHTTPWDRHLI